LQACWWFFLRVKILNEKQKSIFRSLFFFPFVVDFTNLLRGAFCAKISKAQKDSQVIIVFCATRIFTHKKLLVKRWWNWSLNIASCFDQIGFFSYWLLRLKMGVWQILTAGDLGFKTTAAKCTPLLKRKQILFHYFLSFFFDVSAIFGRN